MSETTKCLSCSGRGWYTTIKTDTSYLNRGTIGERTWCEPCKGTGRVAAPRLPGREEGERGSSVTTEWVSVGALGEGRRLLAEYKRDSSELPWWLADRADALLDLYDLAERLRDDLELGAETGGGDPYLLLPELQAVLKRLQEA
jgi:hypothetical protein